MWPVPGLVATGIDAGYRLAARPRGLRKHRQSPAAVRRESCHHIGFARPVTVVV